MDWTDTWKIRGDSYNDAMSMFPDARNAERNFLIEPLHISSNHLLLEVAPSGSAFFSKGVKARLGEDFICQAVEPSETHAKLLPSFIEVIPDADFADFKSPPNRFDRIANLAGLHHSPPEDVAGFFSQAKYGLAKDGMLGVADVRTDSAVAEWLNGFVNTYNPSGHDGYFFKVGEFSSFLSDNKFSEIEERTLALTWNFPSHEGMIEFCKRLFYLEKATNLEVEKGITEILGFSAEDGRFKMNWELIYAFGKKGSS